MGSTALRKFERLECTGLWREAPELQRREVVVSFGESSLTISDPRNQSALSHWSLPAVERLNPGEVPALYSPGPDAIETLELEEILMIEALEKIRSVLAHDRPHPGRVRGSILAAGSFLVLAFGALFIPGAMVDHTAAMAPPATRLAIGRVALADLSKVAGAPCTDPSGMAALERLADRLFDPPVSQLVVLRDSPAKTLHLPGNIIAINRSLVETERSPDVAAGYILAEAERAAESDPLKPLLRYAGTRATFGLLTTGQLEPAAVDGYGQELILAEPLAVDAEKLLARFAAAGLPSTPFANTLAADAAQRTRLIEGDPLARGEVRPLLSDQDWIGLQSICAE